jgi:hypothetical protein
MRLSNGKRDDGLSGLRRRRRMLICGLAVHLSCGGRKNVVLVVMEKVRAVSLMWSRWFVHKVVAGRLTWCLNQVGQVS